MSYYAKNIMKKNTSKFYKIADNQIGGRYFADGELFASREEAGEQLKDYHSIDWGGEVAIETLSTDEILEYGEWELEEVEGIVCPLCENLIEHKERGETHYWICDECAFVGFEFNTKKDLENIGERLK